jgi:hypothetical protein
VKANPVNAERLMRIAENEQMPDQLVSRCNQVTLQKCHKGQSANTPAPSAPAAAPPIAPARVDQQSAGPSPDRIEIQS